MEVNKSVRDFIDGIADDAPEQSETQTTSQERVDIRIELYWASEEITTAIYETGHRDKADIVKPRVGNVKNWVLQNVTSLDDFVRDYHEQLEQVGVQYEPRVINLGQEIGEGVLYQHTYRGISHELVREIEGLLNFMVRQYSS